MRAWSHIARLGPGAVLAAVLTVGCGDSPMGPTVTVGPKLSCPANQTTQTSGRSVSVNYPPATASGGTAPVSIACTPASGSSFPVGSSVATCVATDAAQRTDRCTFTITVELVPLLGATRFVAFGDSITEGKLATGDITPVPYPAGLKQMLTARYTSQTFTVVGEGGGGETTFGGVIRLPGVLTADNPEVLLLFEGVNDLPANDPSTIGPMVNNLQTMIGQARGRGVQVMLATLLPEIPGAQRAGAAGLIVPANNQIRALASSQNVPLVDLYQAFVGQETTLLGFDGLHPSDLGYQTIARTFFDAIRSRFEVSPTLTLTHLPSPPAPWRGE